MAKDQFWYEHVGSPDEIAEYLTTVAMGLKRDDVSLTSSGQTLRLAPPAEVKLALAVEQKSTKGKLKVQIGWKRQTASRLSDLQVHSARAFGDPGQSGQSGRA